MGLETKIRAMLAAGVAAITFAACSYNGNSYDVNETVSLFYSKCDIRASWKLNDTYYYVQYRDGNGENIPMLLLNNEPTVVPFKKIQARQGEGLNKLVQRSWNDDVIPSSNLKKGIMEVNNMRNDTIIAGRSYWMPGGVYSIKEYSCAK